MATKAQHQSTKSTRHIKKVLKRKTIASRDVGVTLRISEKALKEIDDCQAEAIKAAHEDEKFSWR